MGGGLAVSRLGSPRLVWVLCLCCALLTRAAGAQILSASAIAYDAAGNLYIADARANQVVEATLGGSLLVVAGSGTQGFSGDGGLAAAAQLNGPQGIVFGPDGTLYIADTGNQRVRAVNVAGGIATVAGTGVPGFAGDGGLAAAAVLRGPTALAVDATGALLVCDTGNQRLRRVRAGVIATVAGSGVQGFAGDGGPALAAELDAPSGVAADGNGRVFVADTHNHRVRVIDTDGVISTFAGNGIAGFAGDGGPAAKAELAAPRGLAFTSAGELLVADANNQRVRRISAGGLISTAAGTGTEGASADGVAVAGAAMRSPRGVAVSSFGVPVVADTDNATVRAVWNSQRLYAPAALATGRQTKVALGTSLAMTYGAGVLPASVSGAVGTAQGALQAQESGGQPFASAALSGGTASLDLGSLGAGSHTVTVGYLGDGLNPSAASSVAVAVAPAALRATAASATMPYGASLPALMGGVVGVLPQDGAQVAATFGVSAGDLPAVGMYPIGVTLTGAKAGNYTVAMAAGSGQLTVTKANSVASLDAVGQAFAGLPVTLTARVTPAARGVPTGAVQFLDAGAVVATGTLSGGVASAVYAAPPGGSRAITLQYLGVGNVLPPSSAPSTVAVSALPDFLVSPGGAQTASATAGSVATYTLLVSSQPGPFTGAVSLSASGLPAGANVSFSPPQVVPGVETATVLVSVQTAAPVSAARVRGSAGGGEVSLAVLMLSGCGVSRRRRRQALVGLLGGLMLLCGCGARTVGEGLNGVISQTYSLQITGTATNLAGAVVSHSLPLTLTVQQ